MTNEQIKHPFSIGHFTGNKRPPLRVKDILAQRNQFAGKYLGSSVDYSGAVNFNFATDIEGFWHVILNQNDLPYGLSMHLSYPPSIASKLSRLLERKQNLMRLYGSSDEYSERLHTRNIHFCTANWNAVAQLVFGINPTNHGIPSVFNEIELPNRALDLAGITDRGIVILEFGNGQKKPKKVRDYHQLLGKEIKRELNQSFPILGFTVKYNVFANPVKHTFLNISFVEQYP